MSKILKLVALLLALACLVWLSTRDRPEETGGRSVLETGSTTKITRESSTQTASDVMPSLATSPAQTPRAEVTPIPAEASVKVPVHVRLVDDETHDPVPHLVAELRSSEETLERFESDERGLLVSTALFTPGAYRLDLSSERASNDLIQSKRKSEASAFPHDVEFTLAARDSALPPIELAVPVGPTIEFVAPWPGGLTADAFRAHLGSADPRQRWDKLYAPVRRGSPPWTRFSP